MRSLEKFVAVFLREAHINSPDDEADELPLYEESFVLLEAASLDEAFQLARGLNRTEPGYISASGATVTWSQRLFSVGSIVDDTFTHGSELYSRFFRNSRAYAELQFEDFSLQQAGD